MWEFPPPGPSQFSPVPFPALRGDPRGSQGCGRAQPPLALPKNLPNLPGAPRRKTQSRTRPERRKIKIQDMQRSSFSLSPSFFLEERRSQGFPSPSEGPWQPPGSCWKLSQQGWNAPGWAQSDPSPPKSRFHTPPTPFPRIYRPRLSRRWRLLCGILSQTLPAAAAWAKKKKKNTERRGEKNKKSLKVRALKRFLLAGISL